MQCFCMYFIFLIEICSLHVVKKTEIWIELAHKYKNLDNVGEFTIYQNSRHYEPYHEIFTHYAKT